jgi:hypothetical protein
MSPKTTLPIVSAAALEVTAVACGKPSTQLSEVSDSPRTEKTLSCIQKRWNGEPANLTVEAKNLGDTSLAKVLMKNNEPPANTMYELENLQIDSTYRPRNPERKKFNRFSLGLYSNRNALFVGCRFKIFLPKNLSRVPRCVY